MPWDAANKAPPWWTGSAVVGYGHDFCRALGSLFEATRPEERDRLAHRIGLFVLIACGAVLRFWGLGDVGLHGDEETMAMATMGIVEQGAPILPSGMFYPRGLTELYLMALSVGLFGESEWAFRLPSALCGVALIGLMYLAGRRFLRPEWNLALAATVAFLPDIVIYSQTARMYIFVLAAIAACMTCIFAWERTERVGWLIAAIGALIIGIELHALAVTSVLLFFLPGILKGDLRTVIHGTVAAAVVMVAYLGIDAWQSAQYPVPPPEYAADLGPPHWELGSALKAFHLTFDIALWIAGIAIAFFAVHLGRVIPQRGASRTVVLLLLAGLVAQLLLYYHVAGLLFIAGTVVAHRFGGPKVWRRLSIVAMACAVLALIHLSLMVSTPGTVVQLFGALVGQPSVWPYYRIMEYSYVAGALLALSLVHGLIQVATGRPVKDYDLLALLGVWIPTFTIGFFLWDVPSRYTVASLLPMLMTGLAFAQGVTDRVRERTAGSSRRWLPATFAAVAVLVIVDPAAAARVVDAGYTIHPDHKGAAEYLRSQHVSPEDIVVAEDVLQQTYYLGSVDYWLMSRRYARRYVERVDGRIRDFYTGTPVISSAQTLTELLDREAGAHRVFIVGSGENQSDGRRGMRGDMLETLQSDRLEVVYEGRDGYTKVWRAVAPPSPAE
jgi:Dolichyl-phosphate-mannose-protein mannosyltransferase